MERITLMSVLLTVVVSSSPRQYHFVNQKKNWTEAQRYCREKYTDLVSINDKNEQNDTNQLLQRVISADRVWIGLQDAWVWSLNYSDFYRGDESQFRKWGPDQPNGDGDCIYMNNDGQWHDVDCRTTRYFICYNGSSKGFVPVQEQKNWIEAQKHCREKHTDLASVRNESENEQIKNLTSPNQAWIGLQRFWVWSDNSKFISPLWSSGQPNSRDGNKSICVSTDKLVLIRENKTWSEALRYCRNMSMDLVSVDSEQMQKRVMNVTSSALSDHVWLGLRHSCTVGIWFWVNGQTVCYDQWASGYDSGPDECDKTVRSGVIRKNDTRWISRPETDRYNFICIK
ncbi:macrophage mannose receptor 1-like [Carassius auratus]|uniref:Macrophage mannose receptor 1-like n=1 Tax=Carassius auratus TaxID=7957 RepID=A0A6P6JAL3_CARAU|nr:macrophage mannose receptor 1-like [Carassius auratus]XP_026054875.1 macrophage mannose receptor 1-like [Carassius auratus]